MSPPRVVVMKRGIVVGGTEIRIVKSTMSYQATGASVNLASHILEKGQWSLL